MRVLSVFFARQELVAGLMMALAILAAPSPGLAGTPDAHSAIAVGVDGAGVSAGHAAPEDTLDRSCHPDPTCSSTAILMARPIFGARGFRAARHPFAKTATRGRTAPVDLPPPRPWAVSQPNPLNDLQT
jgi:hypothetical protein